MFSEAENQEESSKKKKKEARSWKNTSFLFHLLSQQPLLSKFERSSQQDTASKGTSQLGEENTYSINNYTEEDKQPEDKQTTIQKYETHHGDSFLCTTAVLTNLTPSAPKLTAPTWFYKAARRLGAQKRLFFSSVAMTQDHHLVRLTSYTTTHSTCPWHCLILILGKKTEHRKHEINLHRQTNISTDTVGSIYDPHL